MAVDLALNDGIAYRSVVTYQHRRRNPEYDWKNRDTVPALLDGWDEELCVQTRGPYDKPGSARVQAGRDAGDVARSTVWNLGQRVPDTRIVSVAIEATPLAWAEVDVRDLEKGWGG